MTVSKLILLFAFLSISAMVKSEDCVNPETAGSDYTGTVNVTKTGLTCQKWSAQEPQSHTAGVEIGDINFCRNPDNGETVWCYTIDPDTRWQYCDVPFCDSTNTTTTSSITTAASIDPTTTGFLLLGGLDDGSKDLDNVEVYGSDLSLPSLPSLPLPLYYHIAEMTESGAVYVAGGQNSDGSYNGKTFMLSSLSSSKWEELEARMPSPVTVAGSVVVNDIVLVLGGSGSDAIQMLDTSKSLPTWKLLKQSKLPEPQYWHSAAVFEGQVIIVTRYGVTYTTSVSSIISDTQLHWVEGKLSGVESYAYGPGIEVVGGKLVAVHRSKVFTKTTMDSQWIQLKPLPQVKEGYPSIGSVQGNVVIAGGSHGGASDTVFMWVEASSEWEEVNSLKIPRSGHATVQLPKDL